MGSRAQPTLQRGPSWPQPAICGASAPPSGHLPSPRRQQLGGEQEAASRGPPTGRAPEGAGPQGLHRAPPGAMPFGNLCCLSLRLWARGAEGQSSTGLGAGCSTNPPHEDTSRQGVTTSGPSRKWGSVTSGSALYTSPPKAGGQYGQEPSTGGGTSGLPGRRLGGEGLQPWMLRAHSGHPSRTTAHSHAHSQRGDRAQPLVSTGTVMMQPPSPLHTIPRPEALVPLPGFSRFSWAPAGPPQGVTPHPFCPPQADVLLTITPPPQRHLIRSPPHWAPSQDAYCLSKHMLTCPQPTLPSSWTHAFTGCL